MNLKDALDTAITVETELRDRYIQVADLMHRHRTSGAAALFRDMAGKQSAQIAQVVGEREELFGTAERTVDDDSILRALEEPDFSKLRAYMSPHQALRVALHCEQRVRRFFLSNLDNLSDDAARDLFTRLARTDLEHEDMLRQELVNLGAEDTSNPMDFADEPVAM